MIREFAILLCLHAAALGAEPPAGSSVTALPSQHVHNLFRAGTNLFSGSAPESDAGFAELARLGVKTLVSVDGARPDIATARRHGLRYVHLPIGYDGVPTNRITELVRATQLSPGPVYLHCHHGLHRGPAAVAVLCQATAGWTTNEAVAWMRQAGTAGDYAGLYRSAMNFRPPDAAAVTRITALPEVVPTSGLIEVMVGIDRDFARLKAAQKNNWPTIGTGEEPALEEAAKLVWEQLRELTRTEATAGRPASYRATLESSERAAGELHAALKSGSSPARDAAFRSLSKSCVVCHREHRN